MEIEIKKDGGHLYALCGLSTLFQFEYRDGCWYFWLRGGWDPDIFKGPKRNFPLDFFNHACTAKVFIKFSKWDQEVTITKGKHHLS